MKLQLDNQREVVITKITQSYHYNQGVSISDYPPNEEYNDMILEDLEEELSKAHRSSYHIITPKRYSKSEIEELRNLKYSEDFEYELLPDVLCIVDFHSRQPKKNTEADYSILTVAWFQDKYAFPIDNQILEQLKEIPWDKKAHNISYDDYI